MEKIKPHHLLEPVVPHLPDGLVGVLDERLLQKRDLLHPLLDPAVHNLAADGQ